MGLNLTDTKVPHINVAKRNEDYHALRREADIKERTMVMDDMTHYGLRAYSILIGDELFVKHWLKDKSTNIAANILPGGDLSVKEEC